MDRDIPNYLLVILFISAFLLGAALTAIYDREVSNDYVELISLQLDKMLNICREQYLVNASITEEEDKYVFEISGESEEGQ